MSAPLTERLRERLRDTPNGVMLSDVALLGECLAALEAATRVVEYAGWVREHEKDGNRFAAAEWRKRLDAALAAAGVRQEPRPERLGGFIDQPTKREMGVDAPDFGPILGAAVPPEAT